MTCQVVESSVAGRRLFLPERKATRRGTTGATRTNTDNAWRRFNRMIKRISILVRAPHIDREGFSTHWHDVHGGLVARLPGIGGYVQNHVVEEFPVENRRDGYDVDGFVGLYFPDDAARVGAFSGVHAQPVWEDEPHFLGHSTAYVIAGDREPRKVMTDAKLVVVAQGIPAAIDRLENSLQRLTRAAEIERDDVAEVVPRATMERGPQLADVFVHLRFAEANDAREAGRALQNARGMSEGLERLAITRVVERRIV